MSSPALQLRERLPRLAEEAVARARLTVVPRRRVRVSQPTISHHLKVLHETGLLDRSKRGVWVYYRVKPEALSDLGALIGGVAG